MKKNKPIRILVAEDNAIIVAVLRVQLDRLGCETTFVGDGLSALNEYVSGEYDIIFMDLQLPVMDGLEAIREMRKVTKGVRRTPIVVLSACTLDADRLVALDAGADHYLSKPIRSHDLTDSLQKWGPKWFQKLLAQYLAA